MINKISVKQNGYRDCAAACILSILRYYGSDASKEEISINIKTDIHGTNAYNLIEGSKQYGLNGYGIKLEFNELIKIKDSFPIIAHIKNSNMYHYIVLYEIKKNTVKIMDPAYGIKKISYNEFKNVYMGVVIVLYPVKKLENLNIRDKLFKTIFDSVLLDKKLLIKTIIISILITILSIINNLYLKVFIDYIFVNFTIKLLIITTIVFSISIFLKNIFDNIRTKMLSKIKKTVGTNVTNDAVMHVLNLPYCYFKSKPTGEIVSRIDDLDNFKNLVSTIILNIFANIMLMVGSLVVLIMINKILFYISLIIILFYSIVVFIYSNVFKNKIYNIQRVEGEYKKELIESIECYETLKNLNLISCFISKIRIKYNTLMLKIKSLEYSLSNQTMIKNIISELGLLVIASIGIFLVYNNSITIGDLIVFSFLILYFIEPVKELLNLEPNIRYAIGSYERINDLMQVKQEENNNMDKHIINGNIFIKNLSYSYNNVDYIFRNLNLQLKEKQNYLIFGDSGCGKSTLVKLLLKYLDGYNGEIYFSGKNIKDISNEVIRNSITYISQKEVILNETIKNNIILHREIKNKEYENIIKICRVDKIINNTKLRENFIIEDNGFNLSGGERQKIILARGLLKKANYIILDEALSEVGFDEEKEIIKEILKKYNDKTIIYISHKEEIKTLFENKISFSEERRNYVN